MYVTGSFSLPPVSIIYIIIIIFCCSSYLALDMYSTKGKTSCFLSFLPSFLPSFHTYILEKNQTTPPPQKKKKKHVCSRQMPKTKTKTKRGRKKGERKRGGGITLITCIHSNTNMYVYSFASLTNGTELSYIVWLIVNNNYPL